MRRERGAETRLDRRRRKNEDAPEELVADVSPQTAPRPLPIDLPSGVTRGHVAERDGASLSTGSGDLDRLLRGGFPRGRLSEIYGPPSSGRTSLVHRFLAAATARGETVALVDEADRFDPRHAARSGIALARVLWVRPGDVTAALRAVEILLGTRGLGAVVLDLADGLAPSRAVRLGPAWPRLAARAAASRAVFLLVGRKRIAESFSALCLSLSGARALWPRHRLRSPLLGGLETQAEVVRARNATPGNSVRIRFGDDARFSEERKTRAATVGR